MNLEMNLNGEAFELKEWECVRNGNRKKKKKTTILHG